MRRAVGFFRLGGKLVRVRGVTGPRLSRRETPVSSIDLMNDWCGIPARVASRFTLSRRSGEIRSVAGLVAAIMAVFVLGYALTGGAGATGGAGGGPDGPAVVTLVRAPSR